MSSTKSKKKEPGGYRMFNKTLSAPVAVFLIMSLLLGVVMFADTRSNGPEDFGWAGAAKLPLDMYVEVRDANSLALEHVWVITFDDYSYFTNQTPYGATGFVYKPDGEGGPKKLFMFRFLNPEFVGMKDVFYWVGILCHEYEGPK